MESPNSMRLIHPRAILVATDLSDLQRLMPFALQMASETDARLQLLHVLPVSAGFMAGAAGMPYYDPQAASSEASTMLEPWCERARKLGLRCVAIVRNGQPATREIVAAVNHFHPDRLILGTRSLSRLGKLLLGSVAEQVLRSVDLPVFTVGPEAHLSKSSACQRTVLFATTLGEGYQANAALACQFATAQGARLVMLHVLPALPEGKIAGTNVLLSTVTCELQELSRRIGAGSCTGVEIKVAHGNPADRILAEAASGDASLIVMGPSDHSMLDSIAHDHTVGRVLAHAQCPVLSLHGLIAEQSQSVIEVVAAH